MTNKFRLFALLVLVVSFVACSKSNNSTPVDNSPNITINGKRTNLLAVSKAYYLSNSTNDSIVLINSNSTDNSLVSKLTNGSKIDSSVNYLDISIYSKNTISQSTYNTNVGTSFQINNNQYTSIYLLPSSVTIDTLKGTSKNYPFYKSAL